MKTALIALLLFLAANVHAAIDLVITWNPVPVSESNLLYRVYISTNNGPFFLGATSVQPSVVLPNVTPGLVYCASVTASNILGEQQIRSVPGCAYGPLAVPSVVTGVNVLLQYGQ